jgi:hypothetical protein
MSAKIRAGSRFKRFLCFVLIDVTCVRVPRGYTHPSLKTADLCNWPGQLRRYSYGYGLDGVLLTTGARNAFTVSRLPLGPTQPTILRVPNAIPRRVNRSRREASAQIKNGGATPSLLHTSSWYDD